MTATEPDVDWGRQLPRIALLITNGCSYTRGAELAHPNEQAWPAVLAGILNVPVVNLASDGGSNRRIVRTTVENFDRIRAEYSLAPSEILVMCMWTGLARFEHRRRMGHDKGKRPHLPDETRWHRLGRWRIDEGDAASEAYFGYLWDEQGAAVNFLLDWLLLDSFLCRRGAMTRYVYAWDTLPRKLSGEAVALKSLLNPARTYGDSKASNESSFYGAVAGRYPVGQGRHPLSDGHFYFARALADWLARAE